MESLTPSPGFSNPAKTRAKKIRPLPFGAREKPVHLIPILSLYYWVASFSILRFMLILFGRYWQEPVR